MSNNVEMKGIAMRPKLLKNKRGGKKRIRHRKPSICLQGEGRKIRQEKSQTAMQSENPVLA